MPPRTITLDLDQLLQEKRITADEYHWLLGLVDKEVAVQTQVPNLPRTLTPLTHREEEAVRAVQVPGHLQKEQSWAAPSLELLLLLGGLLVVGGALALLQSMLLLILLGLILTSCGSYFGLALNKKWELPGAILVLIGIALSAVGIVMLSKGNFAGFVLLTILFGLLALLLRDAFFAVPAVAAIAATVTAVAIQVPALPLLLDHLPSLMVLLFSVLSLGAYVASLQLPGEYARVARCFAGTSFVVVNLAFWVGSLTGDPGGERTDGSPLAVLAGLGVEWRIGDGWNGPMVPPWLFLLGWGLALLGTGLWAVFTHRLGLVNGVILFGSALGLTQWFVRLGWSPGAVLGGGVLILGIGLGAMQYNRIAKLGDRGQHPAQG
jgi:hypothetical protein